jgi:hypothetical protein
VASFDAFYGLEAAEVRFVGLMQPGQFPDDLHLILPSPTSSHEKNTYQFDEI